MILTLWSCQDLDKVFYQDLDKNFAGDATFLQHCLKNKHLHLKCFSGKDPAKGVFTIMHSYLGLLVSIKVSKQKKGH